MVTVGYSGLQQVTAGYRVVTGGYNRLQQVTEWLQWVTAGCSRLTSRYSGLQQSTAGYRVVTQQVTGYCYSRSQQVTEMLQWASWLQWVTVGYSRLLSGYSALQKVTAVTEWLQ